MTSDPEDFNGWPESDSVRSMIDDALRDADDGELYLQGRSQNPCNLSTGD